MTPLIDLDSPLTSCFYSVPSKRGAPFISMLTMSHSEEFISPFSHDHLISKRVLLLFPP
jgi:hypothetical protein